MYICKFSTYRFQRFLTLNSKISIFFLKGDSIKFGKKTGDLSNGRITAIRFDKRSRKKSVEVKVLELHNKNELMDGGKSMSTVVIEENQLQGQILILGGKDYSQVDWSKNSRVYVQKKA